MTRHLWLVDGRCWAVLGFELRRNELNDACHLDARDAGTDYDCFHLPLTKRFPGTDERPCTATHSTTGLLMDKVKDVAANMESADQAVILDFCVSICPLVVLCALLCFGPQLVSE